MPKVMDRTCRWHKCGQKFKTENHLQHFCGPKCRRSFATWAKTRGAVIVNALLDAKSTGEVRDIGPLFYKKLYEERDKGA